MLTKTTAILMTVGIGLILALQPAINAEVARRLGSGTGAVMFSLLISVAVMVAYLGLTRPTANVAALPTAPWWIWASGVIGALFLLTGLTATPVIGATLFFLFLIVGQVTGAAIADHFGLVGLEPQQISPKRILGIACVIVGAIIIAS
ncbi:MAG: DMT family transporter [Pseudomonadota bacterium]